MPIADSIIFPAGCNTPKDRHAYLRRRKRRSINLHNQVGKWRREGLTKQQWEHLPGKIKKQFPFKQQMTGQDWTIFAEKWEFKHDEILHLMDMIQEAMEHSTAYDADINEEELYA